MRTLRPSGAAKILLWITGSPAAALHAAARASPATWPHLMLPRGLRPLATDTLPHQLGGQVSTHHIAQRPVIPCPGTGARLLYRTRSAPQRRLRLCSWP